MTVIDLSGISTAARKAYEEFTAKGLTGEALAAALEAEAPARRDAEEAAHVRNDEDEKFYGIVHGVTADEFMELARRVRDADDQ